MHTPVLLKETIDNLSLTEGDAYLDATCGSGGHMEEVWRRMGAKVKLLGIDADEVSIEITKERLELAGAKPNLAVLNFRNIDQAPEIFGVRPSKILFDLGWSKEQFEGEGKGFSFLRDEPLLMTFKSQIEESDTTAYDVVNNWSEENLSDVIYGFGEEKFARRIAKAIAEKRQERPIKTSGELAEIVKEAVPIFARFGRIHPATRTFQAIRIAVNDELRALEEGMGKAFKILENGGRLAVISFHSLEDRIVKNFFKSQANAQIITKKPLTAAEEEIKSNPRSRSAKLRVLQK